MLEGMQSGITDFISLSDVIIKFEESVITNLNNVTHPFLYNNNLYYFLQANFYFDLSFTGLKYGIYGILVFFSVIIGTTFTLLIIRIKKYKPLLNF